MPRPSRHFVILAALVVLMASGACKKDSETITSPATPGTPAAGLVGSWRYTRAEYVALGNSSLRVEVIGRGTTMTIAFDSAGTYTQTITDPGKQSQVLTGTWTASLDVLTLRQTGVSGESQFDFVQSGNGLTVSGGHVPYDIDGNGTFEESILSATLVR